jgi:hypothetical protein
MPLCAGDGAVMAGPKLIVMTIMDLFQHFLLLQFLPRNKLCRN